MYKAIIIIIGVFLITLIGTCVYFVAGVSSTYPPLKEYAYSKSFSNLIRGVDELVSADKRLTYKITDTTGYKEVGYKYYVTIKFKRESENLEYQFFYDKTDYWFKKDVTEIGLVFAYDQTHNTGGYGYKNGANRTHQLVQIFENEILNRLPK